MDYAEFLLPPASPLFGTTTPKGAIYVIMAQVGASARVVAAYWSEEDAKQRVAEETELLSSLTFTIKRVYLR